MYLRFTFFVMVLLAVWVGVTVVRIERLNAQAGFYLPQRGFDGEWRVSRDDSPRDRLRGLVGGVGQMQYLFAPLVIGLAIFHHRRRVSTTHRVVAIYSGVVGVIALGLAFYRGYFSSLSL